jgi:hypothetical protein
MKSKEKELEGLYKNIKNINNYEKIEDYEKQIIILEEN